MFRYSFGSDNHSGVHPNVMQALQNANDGYCFGYGDDPITEKAIAMIKDTFGGNCDVFLVMTGTGANVIALQSLMNSFHAVICATTAHINIDECGAVQKFTQARLHAVDTPDGKLTVELLDPLMHGRGDQHHSQKRILSVSQSTEYGTLYTVEELKILADFAHKHSMYFHIDGARLANAAAALGVSLKTFTKDIGADIISFGGTKNGMMFGEAIISFVPQLTKDIIYYRKQCTQLYSKMRYVGAQFVAYLKDDLWLCNALAANAMAAYLSEGLQKIPQVKVTQTTRVNAVFAIIPPIVNALLQEKYMYYTWNEQSGEIRLMCSYSTTQTDIDMFIKDLKELLDNPEAGIAGNEQYQF